MWYPKCHFPISFVVYPCPRRYSGKTLTLRGSPLGSPPCISSPCIPVQTDNIVTQLTRLHKIISDAALIHATSSCAYIRIIISAYHKRALNCYSLHVFLSLTQTHTVNIIKPCGIKKTNKIFIVFFSVKKRKKKVGARICFSKKLCRNLYL